MKATPTELEFNERMGRRLKEAREAARYTQKQMADELGISPDAYAKYENRPSSVLPPYLIPRVCAILGMDAWWLLTGRFKQDSDDDQQRVSNGPPRRARPF
jgi:transcriptional regulator with XRE-family HTH domain